MKYCGNEYMEHSMKDVLHGKLHLELCYDSPQVKQNLFFTITNQECKALCKLRVLRNIFLNGKTSFSVQLGNKKISKLHGS